MLPKQREKKDFLITLENQIFFVDSFLSGSFRAKFWTFFLFQHFYSKAKIILFPNWQKLQFLKKIQFPFSVNEGYNRTTRKVSRTTNGWHWFSIKIWFSFCAKTCLPGAYSMSNRRPLVKNLVNTISKHKPCNAMYIN